MVTKKTHPPQLCNAGHCVAQKPNLPAAALLINALYAAYNDPQHCQHTLRWTQKGGERRLMGPNMKAFMVVMRSLKTNDPLQLTIQLNALACLARLCALELHHDGDRDWMVTGDDFKVLTPTSSRPWFKEALSTGALQCGMGAIATALAVSLPLCDPGA